MSDTYPKTGKKQTQGVGKGGKGDVERASPAHTPCSGRVSALRAASHPFPRILKSSLPQGSRHLSLSRPEPTAAGAGECGYRGGLGVRWGWTPSKSGPGLSGRAGVGLEPVVEQGGPR